MLPLLAVLTLAQAIPDEPPPEPVEVVRPQEVRSLPGQFDDVPMFNSNSPELVQSGGILLSTFSPEGKTHPNAHLNFPFTGRFDVFAHHVYRSVTEGDLTTLYLGILLYNPGTEPVTVDILQAASYLSQPDAPFISLPPLVENPRGEVYAGPGSRAMSDILRGQRQDSFPSQVEVPPDGYQLLMNVPIPIADLDPPINGRSTLMRVRSSDTVYAASLALFAPTDDEGVEREPTLDEWIEVLNTGELAEMRDRTPTPLDQTTGQVIYGRVSGVSEGSLWQAQVVDSPESTTLTIPAAGEAFSYGISTLIAGRMGTEQVQSAPMLVRYPDTAYQSHGNYAAEYNLSLPLYNPDSRDRTVTIALETPLKEDSLSTDGLRFLEPPAEQVFFRGTVRLRYTDDRGFPQTRYVHLVEQRGQMGEPLVTLTMPGETRRLVNIDLLYPPDSTPPQMLTVQTLVDE
ncbi:MAG: DUF3370 domain-containing protein [Synechococcales cyanobacterium T60_A2020_003]|nr:DUF3370 domain-containing protein [Synechococcales cyanobacterium T60_A2020_003]